MAEMTNMLDYIGDKMDALDFDGDLELNWDKEAHVLEVEITMYVDAAEGFEVEDQDGQTIDNGGEVDYVDAIMFYDRTRLKGEEYADNYLAIFDFAGKQGIEQARVDALFTYLQTLLDDGQSDLFDFVDGTTEQDTFELSFDQAAYDAVYAAQPNHTKRVLLPYPKF